MKKILFLAALCAATFVSCTQKEIVIDEPQQGEIQENLIPITITANFEAGKADMVDATWTWKSGDKLAVYDGTAKREFTLSASSAGTSVAQFTGEVAASFTSLKAVFPFAAAGDSFGTPEIPAEQTVSDGTIDAAAMIAVANDAEKVSDTEYNFYFTSGISLLRFTPPAGATKVILCAATDGDQLTGTSSMVKVSLSGADGTKRFWAAVNPATYHGIKVFTRTSAGDYLKGTSADIDLSAPGKGRNLGSLSGGTQVAVLESADDYTAFASGFKAGNYSDDIAVHVLNDLDFSGKTFATVDDGTHKYAGVWNGNGYMMKNVTSVNVPMFYTPAGAKLNDIIIDGSCSFSKTTAYAGHWGIIARTLEPGEMNRCEVHCDYSFDYKASSAVGYGGLVGRTTGSISNCKMYGDFIYTRTTDAKETAPIYAGGVVGFVNGGSASGCEMHGNVLFNLPDEAYCPVCETTNKYYCIGGVVGYDSGTATVEDCSMYGNLTYKDHVWNAFVGGVIGNHEGTLVNNCTMNGDLTAVQQYSTVSYERLFVGGVLGRSTSKVTNCTSTSGKSLAIGSSVNAINAGGVVGSLLNSADVSACANNMSVTQSNYGAKLMYIGGVIGQISGGKVSNVQNYGPVSVSKFSSESGGSVRVGGVIGQCSVDIDGGTVTNNISSIYNAAQVMTDADESSIGYSHANFGGVIGVLGANGKNLTNSGKVYINFGNNKDDTQLLKHVAAGGVIGRLNLAKTVDGCINTAYVQFRYWGSAAQSARVEYMGGIVGCVLTGQNSGGLAATIKNCTNKGYLSDSINNSSYSNTNLTIGKCIGGIVGAIVGTSDSYASVKDCTCNSATANSSSAGYFGCIVGHGNYVNITGCMNSTTTTAISVGGVVAMASAVKVTGCEVKNCTIKGFTACGGIANGANNAANVFSGNKIDNVAFESKSTINANAFGAIARNPVAATTVENNGIRGSFNNNGTTTAFSASYAPYTGTGTFTCSAGNENYIITD
jgi:hypothetical protein